MAYAERTSVTVPKSKTDIEKVVKKYGAESWALMEQGATVKVAFRIQGRNILFAMNVPDGVQKERTIWRALLLTIKAKLESASSGIETFEEAFLANIVMPDGQTVAEHTRPAIEAGYSGDNSVPLLPHF